MPDVAVFKIESLTEGGYVVYAPKFSEYRENLDLASKSLVVEVEAWTKKVQAEIREQARLEAKGETTRSSAPPRIVTA